MPLRFDDGVWWVRAQLATEIETPGLALDSICSRIRSTGVEFDIEQAAGSGDFLPLARLTLHTLTPDRTDVAFDPTVHSDPAVQLLPQWLTTIRRAAYRGSREGRDAE